MKLKITYNKYQKKYRVEKWNIILGWIWWNWTSGPDRNFNTIEEAREYIDKYKRCCRDDNWETVNE